MMSKLFLLGLLMTLLAFAACEKPKEDKVLPPFHEQWDVLLQKYVNESGDVDYSNFKAEESKLKDYLDYLQQNPPTTTWSDNQEMAYWINLYNAFTIYNILLEYPTTSILNIDNGAIWTTRTVAIGDTSYTLDEIEKNNLLARFGEEKVHFAVNCAAVSCPPLLNKAWEEDNIQQYYEQQTKAFINDTTYNQLSANNIVVSKIFDWYASDFGGANNLVTYIQAYSNIAIDSNATVSYSNYDWALNEQ